VLGRTKLVAEDLLPDNTVRRYFSSDAGRSWTPVASRTGAEAGAIPYGAVLETQRDARHGGLTSLCLGGVSVVLPSTGESAVLAVQPDIVTVWCGRYPDAHGTWWVAGRILGTGTLATASSRDNGRSWQVKELPGGNGRMRPEAGESNYPKIGVVSSGSATFAVLTNPVGAHELSSIYENTAAGWAKTWQPAGAGIPFGVLGSAVTSPDGKLWIPASNHSGVGPPANVWVSADGGRTLRGENWGPGPMAGDVEWTRGGYVSLVGDTTVYRSLEGVSWQEVTLPTR
jgi:hypothetical protein